MTPAATGISTGIASGPPQYAEFDVSKKSAPGHEDALPAMPSWENAGSKKVLVEEEAVEMDQLKKPEASSQNAVAAAAVPAQTSPATSPGLNRSPYGPPAGAPGTNGYFPASSGIENDPYATNAQDYPPAGGAYGQQATMGVDQGYGVAGVTIGQGRRSPQAYDNPGYNDGGYGQGRGYGAPVRQGTFDSSYGSGGQGGYNNYGAQGSQGYGAGRRPSPPNELPADNGYGQSAGYGQDRRSPAPQGGYDTGYSQEQSRKSPAPQGGYGYGSGNNSTGYGAQPYPSDQYDAAPVASNNTGGFDFGTSAYSRPTPPPGASGYRQPSPPQPQQPAAYPGYKAYQPAGSRQQGGGGW